MIRHRLPDAIASVVWPDRAQGLPRPPSIAPRRLAVDPAALAPGIAGRLRARQVRAIGRLSTSLMTVNIANAAALVVVLRLDGQGSSVEVLWAGFVAVLASWSLLRGRRTAKRPPRETCSEATIRRVVRSAAWFGLVWAVPGLTFLPHLTGFSLAFAASVTTGMIAGGALALYPIPAAAMAYMTPVVVSALTGLWLVYGTPVAGLAFIAAMFLVIFWSAIKRHSDLFVAEFLSRIELDRQLRLIEELLEDTRLELAGSRRLSQERMAQAQKMEAVGQLTKGIAHDFNNLLTAVRGGAELMLKGKTFDSGLLRGIVQVSDRGASQVQRLLAIGQKQYLQPRRVDLADLLADVRRVLEPTLGPSYEIRLEAGSGARVFADPAHLESALFNLAFNARDAMTTGGVITIRARLAGSGPGSPAPGTVAVSVSDTGQGMSAEVLQRATEPFFTTKKFGQGSGLGLSSVAGFARQSGGDITIESSPGAGTTVTVLLPDAAAGEAEEAGSPPAKAAPGPATVLVVEDSPEALPATVEMVRGLGYRALGAETAEAAIDIVARDGGVDVVLTDILLSGPTTGLQLAKALQRAGDGPSVAFMVDRARSEAAEDRTDILLLGKPFSQSALAQHLAQALATSRARARQVPA